VGERGGGRWVLKGGFIRRGRVAEGNGDGMGRTVVDG